MSKSPPNLRSTARSLPIALLRARETVMAPFRDMLAETGLSEQKWRVLRVLSENGPMEQTAISEAACLLLPSLTRMLVSLEQDGLIQRTAREGDRRRTVVTLAEAGHDVIAAHSAASNQIMSGLEERFGAQKLETLLDLLDELTRLDLKSAKQFDKIGDPDRT